MLNPGIVRTVAWLRERGFDTCDSGDGKTHDHPCDREEAYVAIRVPRPRLVGQHARLLLIALRSADIPVVPIGSDVQIQATYDPVDDTALIDVRGLDDAILFPADVAEAAEDAEQAKLKAGIEASYAEALAALGKGDGDE